MGSSPWGSSRQGVSKRRGAVVHKVLYSLPRAGETKRTGQAGWVKRGNGYTVVAKGIFAVEGGGNAPGKRGAAFATRTGAAGRLAGLGTEEGWGPVIERLEALRAYDPLGSEGVDAVQSLLRCEQPVDAAKILLQKHYDPRYLHGSEQRTYSFRISEISTDEAVHQLLQALDS